LRDRDRERRGAVSRVTVRKTASASATSPATWPVSPGWTNEMADDEGVGAPSAPAAGGWLSGEGLGVSDGLIAGNRPEASPASMSWLETAFRFGIGPSGSLVAGEIPGDDALDGDLVGDADAAVTATVTAAEGGVHVSVVTTLAVAVSVTADTELALAATGTCAVRDTGCLSDTELTTQLAVPSPLRQPPVNTGFWLVGWAVRVTVTPDAEPLFPVETCTT
jgi:hypothetical protein